MDDDRIVGDNTHLKIIRLERSLQVARKHYVRLVGSTWFATHAL